MARITYASLFLNFSPDATDTPTITHINNLIKNYYQQAYEVAYGLGYYPSDDTDDADSDPQTIIRAKEFEGRLIAEISQKVQQWHDSGINSDGQILKMPNFGISKELESMIKRAIAKKSDRIASIRVYGHDWDSAEWI